MKYLKLFLKIIWTLYLFLLRVAQAIYSFFLVHKRKVNTQRVQKRKPQTHTRYGRLRRKRISFKAILSKLQHRSRLFYITTTGMFVFGGVAIYVVFFSGLFALNTITVISSVEQNKAEVEGYIQRAIKNKKLSQNTLFFSLGDVKKNILEQNPSIADIRIHRSLPHSVELQIIDRTRAGIWCSDAIETERYMQELLECFYYANDGVIFQRAPNTSQGFLIREIRDKRHKGAQLGDQVLTEQDIQDVDILHAALMLSVEGVSYITIVDDYEMHAGFQRGWETYFSRQDPFVRQVENLGVVLDKHIKNNRRFLEYIDVRYGNKIFYKYIEL